MPAEISPTREVRDTIESRQLGNTELHLSIAGFGASPFGDVYNKIDPAEGTNAVHYAIDRGINYFDVSPYYGQTLAETRLGIALEGYRDRVVLSTKCGRYGADTFDFSAKRITASMEESLTRLRTDRVDLLFAHDVEFGDEQQIVEETIPAMRKLQQQGKARYIGISGYPLNTLKSIASQVPVDAMLTYCRYNLMITDMETVLAPFAQQHGIGLINASALHMGLLTERGAAAWHPAPPAVRDAAQRVVELCKSRGADAPEVALRFALDYAGVASTLIGMPTRAQVDACFKSMHTPNDPALLAEIRSIIAPVLNTVWRSGKVAADG